MPPSPQQVDSTRQWTFMGFEWVVRDVHKLRDYIEGLPPSDDNTAEQDDPEILKESPMLGDNKFKLEIARTPINEDIEQPISYKPTLSLYITPVTVDFAHPDYEMSASMMTAIKCQEDRVGERGARPEWVWEYWQSDWVFRQESEVWECPLPPLSDLLKNARIRDTDSLVICVQIHCPIGPFVPQQPSVYYVPRDLLDGLEASLDNSNTGDVRFICLERLNPDTTPPGALDPSSPSHLRSPSSSTSSLSPFSNETTARKRVIYAHSDILTRRSEYFATMLSSSFVENVTSPGDRKIYTIVVEDADFETVYWLLKFCYANWLLFRQLDDPRAAVDGIGAGWSAKWLSTRGSEWDWKTFRKASAGEESIAGDTRSATSLSNGEASRSSSKAKVLLQEPPSTVAPSVSRPNPSPSKPPSASTSRTTNPNNRRSVAPGPASTTAMAVTMSTSNTSRGKPVPIIASSSGVPSISHYPVSPRTTRQPHSGVVMSPDPHPHPTPPPHPASALSIYQVAHRYAMPALANLALEHMMTTITPQTAFALLLATSSWDELRSLIEDYIVEKWDEVSVCGEFERCCEEIAAGEWGPDGGKTLMNLFRRLRSPLGYPRT
ncbi:hypothetical protein BDN72DRAFT_764405 [Pluteus cervinus]|uniref:Uncharacterized protein n=1 Tax=Pluteus cervinus TaxID=181527 RepID=A0ACD3B2D6_9AGAR|nr:hypothetical protein BDN72DRAFT_764405 [Pluteus cervinus]